MISKISKIWAALAVAGSLAKIAGEQIVTGAAASAKKAAKNAKAYALAVSWYSKNSLAVAGGLATMKATLSQGGGADELRKLASLISFFNNEFSERVAELGRAEDKEIVRDVAEAAALKDELAKDGDAAVAVELMVSLATLDCRFQSKRSPESVLG